MEDDILQGFLEESWENLGQLDTDIVSFEKDTDNDEILASVFRTIHTIKGTCGFIGLVKIGAVAHAAENVLGKMRDNSISRSSEAITHVLEAVDAIKELMQGLENSGEEPALEYPELIGHLEAIAEGQAVPAQTISATVTETVISEAPESPAPESETTPANASMNPDDFVTESGDVDFDALDRAINEAAARHREKMSQEKTESETKPAAAAPQASLAENENKPVSSAATAPNSEKPKSTEANVESGDKKSVADLSIRVNVTVLDRLMNLVGELVLARNQLMQLSRGDEESKYAAPLTHLNRVTTDLQEGVMKTRMQPIGNAWSKLPRLVRDLAKVTSKQIELEMHGADTELDRTVLDAIKDPLTHMVRNSADHGLESTQERLEAGKPEKGTIRLNAYHEGGHVIICIEDDGGGINTDKVLQKLIHQGMVTETEVANLTEYEIHQYIFRPGFSTADQISSVSGRGVGMDVVRTEIERIGGTVDLVSRRGQGTTVRIKIPLTLAIISALVVECGDQSFAIPQLGIVELVRLPIEEKERIERVHDKQVYRLRNRLLPLIRLTEVLQIPSCEEPQSDINIVVVQIGEEQMGLIVDRVFDTEEIVVKPVGSLLKDMNIYQGTTILGDGRVIMILDVSGIASDFGALSNSGNDRDHHDNDRNNEIDTTSLLVFDAGDEKTMAVPLSLVSRLEEFAAEDIEYSSNGPVIQYRGQLLPLQALGHLSSEPANPQPVIVFSDGEQSMGIMVHAIQDVVEEYLSIEVQSQRPGVLGTAVINGKATEVIDTQHYLIQSDPNWFRKSHATHYRVLISNPSAFFRQLLITALRSEKYSTAAVEHSEEAITLLDKDPGFDVVLVDFDQPEIVAGNFLIYLRDQKTTAEIEVIGLCSKRNPYLQQRAEETGCSSLLEKLDVSELTQEIERLCGPRHWNKGASA